MGQAAKKLASDRPATRAEAPIDVSRARLVRRGPSGAPRLTLRTLREAQGLTQLQLSKRSGLAQPDVSKLETASTFDERMVATLRRYVEALGDTLEIVALSKHGHRIAIVGARAKHPSASIENQAGSDLDRLLDAAVELARERATETGREADVHLGLILEAAAHMRSKGGGGKALFYAANKYLRGIPLSERFGNPELCPVCEWADEMRVYINGYLDMVHRLPEPRDSEAATPIAHLLCDWAWYAIPLKFPIEANTARADEPAKANPGAASSGPRMIEWYRKMIQKVSTALVAPNADVETVLRATLYAAGFKRPDVQRFTGAARVKKNRNDRRRHATRRRA
jgi:transcriptional regulator with XRE-family HTH domain